MHNCKDSYIALVCESLEHGRCTRSRLVFLASLAVGVVLGLFVSIGLQRALSPSSAPPEAAAPVQSRPVAERSDLDSEEKHRIALF